MIFCPITWIFRFNLIYGAAARCCNFKFSDHWVDQLINVEIKKYSRYLNLKLGLGWSDRLVFCPIKTKHDRQSHRVTVSLFEVLLVGHGNKWFLKWCQLHELFRFRSVVVCCIFCVVLHRNYPSKFDRLHKLKCLSKNHSMNRHEPCIPFKY